MSDCHVCSMLSQDDPDRIVYEDDHWRAFLMADVPGWVMLASKRHAEGPWGLSSGEAEGLGPAVQSVGAAVRDATSADRVHTVFLGENSLHFHLGFFPRVPGEPSLFDNSTLAAHMQEHQDSAKALVMGGQIRAARAAQV